MSDIRVQKLADLLVNYSVAVKPGQTVAVQGSSLAEPLPSNTGPQKVFNIEIVPMKAKKGGKSKGR